jgi:hypothetical protein
MNNSRLNRKITFAPKPTAEESTLVSHPASRFTSSPRSTELTWSADPQLEQHGRDSLQQRDRLRRVCGQQPGQPSDGEHQHSNQPDHHGVDRDEQQQECQPGRQPLGAQPGMQRMQQQDDHESEADRREQPGQFSKRQQRDERTGDAKNDA